MEDTVDQILTLFFQFIFHGDLSSSKQRQLIFWTPQPPFPFGERVWKYIGCQISRLRPKQPEPNETAKSPAIYAAIAPLGASSGQIPG